MTLLWVLEFCEDWSQAWIFLSKSFVAFVTFVGWSFVACHKSHKWIGGLWDEQAKMQKLKVELASVNERQIVATLALGLRPRQKGCKGAGQEEAGSHITYSRECKKVWGSETSHSQVNSHVGSWSSERTPEYSERNRRGQNSLPWGVLYIIGKVLKCTCLKWPRTSHLNVYSSGYGQKERPGVKIASLRENDSRPLKVKNRSDLLGCRQRATYRWKALDKGYNFALDRIAIKGLHMKFCALKVSGVLVGEISRLPRGSPGREKPFGCQLRGESQSIL
jgi:hypothetical protein